MADDTRNNSDGLRPLSHPNFASRFPSLRRPIETDASRHRSLPPAAAATATEEGSETTFAVLYDEGPEYHMGHFDERGSLRSGHRPDSQTSFAPSFRTRDSRVFSDEHELDRHPDQLANQRLLVAEGYLNPHESYHDQPTPQYNMYPSDALASPTFPPNAYPNEKSPLTAAEPSRALSRQSRASWCECDDDHGISTPQQDPMKIDLEAQNGPSTPTPLIPEKEKKGPAGPGGPGGKGPGGPGGPPPGGPPALPPFPPGFPDELKVSFEGPNDPLNPKNWPSSKKWKATACIASFTFLSPLASSMIAPALEQISEEFRITDRLEAQITLSIFVLAYAIGPMFLAPLSELYGRVYVSQGSNIFFLIFNTACGFAQSKGQLMAFRFLSGLGGSAPLAMGGGVLGDIFKPEERGKAMGLYALGPLLGPAVGPLVGGWVAEKSTWRWMFYATSIVNLFILGAGFIWFPESYAPYLLHLKAKKLRAETNNPDLRAPGEEDLHLPIWKKIRNTMTRAFGMLFSQPIVQVMALYMGFSYGILYLLLSTYPILWKTQYNQSTGISGLNYISIGLGFFIGAPICGKSSDAVYKKLKEKSKGQPGKPEYRMPVVIIFSFFVPVGLLIYGWSANAHTHWIVPNIGAFILAIGTIAAFQCVTTYLVDTFARFAASAVAAVTVLRSLMGFAFPIFAPAMYQSLGFGWGNTVLAIAAIGIGIPTPILLWLFGEKLRKRSSWAQKAKAGPPGGKGPGGPGGKGPGGPGAPGPKGPGGPNGPLLKGPGGPPPPDRKQVPTQ